MAHAKSCFLALFAIVMAACGETAGAGGTGGSAGSGGHAGIGGGDGGASFPCTEAGIRAAIAAGGGPNTFLCDGPTVVTTAAALQIDDDVTLDGEGNLTVDAGGNHRGFIIGNPGVVPPDPTTVELRNMTITGGFAELPEVGGGGVLSAGELTIINCTITNNEAPGGAGIDTFGTLTLRDSTITGNRGPWAINHQGREMTIVNSVISNNAGGGLAVFGLGGLIRGTTISGNSALAGEYGGGILNGGDLSVFSTSVTDNAAERGGGIFNAGDLYLHSSTVARNAAVDGGGVYNADPYRPDGPIFDVGLLTIGYSTISENTAERGGGIYTAGLWQRITNSTVSGNTADAGGGIAMAGTQEGPSSFTLANTTVAANTAPEGSAIWATGDSPEFRFVGNIVQGSCQEAAGTARWVSNGSNVESPSDTCNLSEASDQTGVAPAALMLGPLQDNGGLYGTQTHAPDPGSIAVDAMLPQDCMLSMVEPRQDQRFVNRPVGAACDVGSVEVE